MLKIINQRKGKAPSETSITRQFQWSRIQPDNGEEMIRAIGPQIIQSAFARARSPRGNQWEMRTNVAENTPPWVIPNKRRMIQSSCQVRTSPQPTAAIPQANKRMLINRFAL